MILVCAAGLRGSNADDVAKEVAIYRAHKAAPIVIVDDGETRFSAAIDTISVPAVHPIARVRALHDGRAPVRLRGRARDRRVGPPAARGARLHRDRVRRPVAHRRRSARARSPTDARAARRALLRRAAHAATTTAASKRATAVRLASVLRYATGVAAARHVPGRVRQGRHAEHGRRGPQRRAHEGDRGAHPPDRRDQAPGQDRDRRHLAFRRDAAARAARAGGARRRRAARQPHLPRAAHARRARRRRSSASSGWTRYNIEGDDAIITSSTAAASRATSRRAPTTTRSCAAPSTAPRPSARSPSCAAAPTAAR